MVGRIWCDNETFVWECTINPACVATRRNNWKLIMPEISTLDIILFFIFVIFAVVDMNYGFFFFKFFF